MAILQIKAIILVCVLCIVLLLLRTEYNLFGSKSRIMSVEDEESNEIDTEATNFKGGNSVSKSKEKPILLLFWLTFWGEIHIKEDHLVSCSTPCALSSNRNRTGNSSFILIHGGDPYPLPPAEYGHIPMVLYSQETPLWFPIMSNPEYVAKFNYLMSYRPDSDIYYSTFHIPSLKPKPIPFEEKTGLIAAAFSNCEPVRTAYLKELMKHIKVDQYGACLNNKKGIVARYVGEFKKEKSKILRKYKFTIVFHNGDCDYFVDDSLNHALTAGSVPIFMGTDKVDEILGDLRYSIIKVKDFATPKKLAEYLQLVAKNKTLYNKYLSWKYEGYKFSKEFLSTPQGKIPRPQPFCQLCEIMSKGGKIKEKGLIKAEYCKARQMKDWLPRQ